MSDKKAYTITVHTPDGAKELRVVGSTRNQAIMGAYDYLVRQYDLGKTDAILTVDEGSLKEV